MNISQRLIIVLCFSLLTACASTHPLDRFVDEQKTRVSEKAAYVEADFDFWASAMSPKNDDLTRLREAWQGHSEAFPESTAIKPLEREMSQQASRVVLVSLFMTDYDKADLRDKAGGWTVSPTPVFMTELSESDVVLRTLMPVRNAWARYFLLRYDEAGVNSVTVGNRTSKVGLPIR